MEMSLKLSETTLQRTRNSILLGGTTAFIFLCQVIVPCLTVTQIKVGVMLIGDMDDPYSVHRAGPAVDIAMETVNTRMLNNSYRLVKVLRVYDNTCDARFASGVAAELYYKEQIQALVGPACSPALDSVARLAAYWNIPIVTGLGDGGLFKNKTTYPTLTRFSYCQCRLRKVFASVFRQFHWHDISLIYDENDVSADIMGKTLKEGLQENRYYPNVIPFYSHDMPDLTQLLHDASLRSRIIILVMSGDLLRQFMLKAYDLGYAQSGDYVFMNVELFRFPGSFWGNNDWRRGDSRDMDARIAYESLLRISLHIPYSEDWQNFTVDCKERSQRDYNFTYKEEQINFFVGAFHDAVIRYGRAVNETLSEGYNISDGGAVTRRMWNYTSYDVTGDVIIDDNGDRDTNFAINDMDPLTGQFETVANYWGATPGYSPIPGKVIHWAGNRLEPPPNRPKCGFRSEDAKCQETDSMPAYLVASVSVLGLCLILLGVGVFIYRKILWEKDLNSDAWRVTFDDIKFRNDAGHGSKISSYSLLSVTSQYTRRTKDSDNQSLVSEKGQNFTLLGSYQGETVAVKLVRMYKVDITRNVLLELKLVRGMHHENITKFVGACVEPGRMYLLYEYCRKGSLQDVLQTDNLKLDWTFKMSLLRDIVKGMIYIHHSQLDFHGRLTSANCVVDGKFNVKVTDFGLPSFRKTEWTEKEHFGDRHYELQRLLWTAPEHIRGLRCHGGSKKGDVYSFAIIMEETVSRSVPYDSQRTSSLEVEEIISRVCAKENPPFRPEVLELETNESYIRLMEHCWREDPEERPTFDTVLKIINTFNGGKEVAFVDRLLTRLEEYTSNLEDLVQERTQQLAQEKRKSEMLLDEILPSSVSEKLKQGQPVDPESYDLVTIYFSDIVGFTSLSAMSTPMEVVELLNALYSRFDAAIENFDVYKIETIGDAYMVVSGLPLRNGKNHVLHIARLALQLLLVVANFEVPHKPEHKLQLRIGLHSGPVVAGVVGLKMPRYCLFGDTVNTASRLESNGAGLMRTVEAGMWCVEWLMFLQTEACKIHISQDTKDLLDEVGHFETELRGDVEMKGKGVQTTYWLLRELDTTANHDVLANHASPKLETSRKVPYHIQPPNDVQHRKHCFLNTHDKITRREHCLLNTHDKETRREHYLLNTHDKETRNLPMPILHDVHCTGKLNPAFEWSRDDISMISRQQSHDCKRLVVSSLDL